LPSRNKSANLQNCSGRKLTAIWLDKSKERMRANFDGEARIFLCRNNGRSKVTEFKLITQGNSENKQKIPEKLERVCSACSGMQNQSKPNRIKKQGLK
jgi:hypothetical protein